MRILLVVDFGDVGFVICWVRKDDNDIAVVGVEVVDGGEG